MDADDGADERWTYSADAMRWHPEGPARYVYGVDLGREDWAGVGGWVYADGRVYFDRAGASDFDARLAEMVAEAWRAARPERERESEAWMARMIRANSAARALLGSPPRYSLLANDVT